MKYVVSETGSTCVIEETLDLRRHRGHDRRVEQRVEAGEQERADHDGDQDLHAGIDVALAAGEIGRASCRERV